MNVRHVFSSACGNYVVMLAATALFFAYVARPLISAIGYVLGTLNTL